MKMIHENRSSSSFDANPIRSQLCTCHDSWAVVACAKLWPELVAICHVRVRYNLYEIWIMSYGGEPLLESVLVSVCRPLYKPVDAALSKGLDQSQIVPGQAVPGLKPADIAYFGILLRWDGAKKVIFAYFGWDRFLQQPASTHLDHPGRSCAPSSPGPEGEAPIAAAPSRLAVLGGGSWLRRPPEVPAAGRWWPLSPRSHVVVPTEGFWGPGH